MRANSILKIQNSKLQKLTEFLLNWFSSNARDLPWRRTHDPYAIWVSEIMLQQTQVKTVIPYWERWMRELPTIEAVAKASPDKIHKLWEGLGYYTRARNLQKAAKQIVEMYDGKFPEHFEAVLALPGVGRYTAGAICSIAFNEPTPILDGNVIRVLTRIFGVAQNPKERETNTQLWKLAEELVGRAVPSPPRRGRNTAPYHSHLNQSLMELGAVVCTPRNPQCGICPVQKLCAAFLDNRVSELPHLGKREAATARRFVAFVAERDGRFLVRQRPAGVVNAHLWEFPNVEIISDQGRSGRESARYFDQKNQSRRRSAAPARRLEPEIALAAEQLGLDSHDATPFCIVKHSLTRYRIRLEAFTARSRGVSPKSGNFWKTPAQLQQLAFASAHKRILGQLTVPK